MASQRTVGDWIWTFVGVVGVACIGVAVWMFLGGGQAGSPEEIAKERAEQASAHLAAGREKLEAGDAEGAIEEIEAAIELVDRRDPAIPLILNELGKALVEAGRADEAVRQFRAAFNLRPTFAEPYLHLGRIFAAKDQLPPAWQYQRAALALHSEPVPEDLKETVAALGDSIRTAREEEIGKFRGEWKANPANVEALTVLLISELLETKVAPDAAPAEAIRAALLAVGEGVGGLDAMRESQEAAVADRPGSVVDRAGLGNVLLLSGEFEKAAEVLREALELSGSDPAARNGAALAAVLTGAEGEADAEAAVKRLSASPVVWLTAAAAKLSHGKNREAQAALANALRLNPALPEVYRLLALAMTDEEQKESREAAERAYERLTE